MADPSLEKHVGAVDRLAKELTLAYICGHPEVLFGGQPAGGVGLGRGGAPWYSTPPAVGPSRFVSGHTPGAGTWQERPLWRLDEAYRILNDIYRPVRPRRSCIHTCERREAPAMQAGRSYGATATGAAGRPHATY